MARISASAVGVGGRGLLRAALFAEPTARTGRTRARGAEAQRGAQLLPRDPGQDDLLPGLVGVEVSARERSGAECC
jgi:hypothetical protein